MNKKGMTPENMYTYHDEDCPNCGWPETIEVRNSETMKMIEMECSKSCGWKKTFEEALNEWFERAKKIAWKHLEISYGRSWIKIVEVDEESKKGGTAVFCFIDPTNGDVLKAASWNKPAKWARGNIFTGPDGINKYGANYLR